MDQFLPKPGGFDFRTGSSARCTPERRAELEKQILRLNLLSAAFGAPGLFIEFAARPWLGFSASVVGIGLVVVSLGLFAKARGRSAGFAALGLMSFIGILIFYFIKKHCLNCASEQQPRAGQCDRCGAPLGV